MNTRATAAVRLLAGDKEPVRLASTANLALVGLLTVDSVVSVAGDRVLVKDQTDATENGIYTASEGAWYRAPDSNASRVLLKGMKVHVQEGTVHAGDVWSLVTNRPDLGEDDVEFELFFNTSIADDINAATAALEQAAADIIALGLSAGKATEAEAEAGTSNASWMTPLRTAQCISERAPAVIAWDNGVPGDGSDQTAALQAIVDGFTVSDAQDIIIRGLVYSSLLNMEEKRNITIRGVGSGQGPGAGQKSMLYMTTGAVGAGAPAINCRRTFTVSFRDMYIRCDNAAFNGSLIDYGGPSPVPGDDAVYMEIHNCTIAGINATGCLLSLHGATNGSFSKSNFNGASTHIKLQDNGYASVGFCNVHKFTSLAFLPQGTNYPILGSAEGLTLDTCLFQGSSGDGRVRAMFTSLNRPFKSLKIINPSAIDALAGGVETFTLAWGHGLDVSSGTISSPTGFAFGLGGGGIAHTDPESRGLTGVNISGVHASGVTAMMSFGGTIANKTNVRGIKVAGNTVVVGDLVGSGFAQVENGEFGPNNVYGSPNALGVSKFYQGFPGYADRAAAIVGGLTTGQMFIATAAPRTLQVV